MVVFFYGNLVQISIFQINFIPWLPQLSHLWYECWAILSGWFLTYSFLFICTCSLRRLAWTNDNKRIEVFSKSQKVLRKKLFCKIHTELHYISALLGDNPQAISVLKCKKQTWFHSSITRCMIITFWLINPYHTAGCMLFPWRLLLSTQVHMWRSTNDMSTARQQTFTPRQHHHS